jgi:hypothetical protein
MDSSTGQVIWTAPHDKWYGQLHRASDMDSSTGQVIWTPPQDKWYGQLHRTSDVDSSTGQVIWTPPQDKWYGQLHRKSDMDSSTGQVIWTPPQQGTRTELLVVIRNCIAELCSWTKQITESRSCVAGPSRSPPLNLQLAWRSVLVCGNGGTMQLPADRSVLLRSYSVRTISQQYKRQVNVNQPTVINIKLLTDNTNSKQSNCSISLSLVHFGDQLAKC